MIEQYSVIVSFFSNFEKVKAEKNHYTNRGIARNTLLKTH
ncbi:hypothetical protein KP78_36690 [Jeotgalibacillus soli]|uniref:Uncharacterized protein n=1 Tax=Jeotgalibacillus soli TaxID=889306 RepID=A0A0C2R0J0_9BACL|nr:hypothetical protein KP78_36690 [Jeotgalibacillus soli]